MVLLELLLFVFLLVGPSIQISADGGAFKAFEQTPLPLPLVTFKGPQQDFSNERNSSMAQLSKSIGPGDRPDLYLPNLNPFKDESVSILEKDAGFQMPSTTTQSTIPISIPNLSSTIRLPERMEGIIELLKTFTGNTSIGALSPPIQNPEEIPKEILPIVKNVSDVTPNHKQEQISHYRQEEKENLLHVIHDAKMESDLKASNETNFSIGPSDVPLPTTEPIQTLQTSSETLPAYTTTPDHVQRVLESKDLQNQLLEQLLIKELSRGRPELLSKLMEKLQGSTMIPYPSNRIKQSRGRSIDGNYLNEGVSAESSTITALKNIKQLPTDELPFY